MKKLLQLKFFLLFGFLVFNSCVAGQDAAPKGSTSKRKKMEQKKAAREQKAIKAAEDARMERHLSLQSKETKKRMKQTRKSSDKMNDRQRWIFIKRHRQKNK